MKRQFTTELEISGKGNTQQQAFSSALSKVQSTLLKDKTDLVFLRLQPVDVVMNKATHKSIKERFLFFFLPRIRHEYTVDLTITVEVTCLELDDVEFTEIK